MRPLLCLLALLIPLYDALPAGAQVRIKDIADVEGIRSIDAKHSAFGGGEAEAAWRPMLVDAIGRQMAAHGGIGLAVPVFNAMLRAQEQER